MPRRPRHVEEEEEEEEEEAAGFDEEEARKEAKRMAAAALRSALDELGEDATGTKAVLVERLVAAQAAAAAAEAEGSGGGGEEEEEEPAVEDMEDRALLEEAVRLARESKRQRTGAHDIICVAPSTCGHCREDVNKAHSITAGCARCASAGCLAASWRT